MIDGRIALAIIGCFVIGAVAAYQVDWRIREWLRRRHYSRQMQAEVEQLRRLRACREALRRGSTDTIGTRVRRGA